MQPRTMPENPARGKRRGIAGATCVLWLDCAVFFGLSVAPYYFMTAPMSTLTHLDAEGQARMVDVGDKPVTAAGRGGAQVRMQPSTLAAIRENSFRQRRCLGVARIAGIQAAKRCDELILCATACPG
jgi:hypothetical protein